MGDLDVRTRHRLHFGHAPTGRLGAVLILAVSCMSMACGHTRGYEGPERAREEVARVIGAFEVLPGGIQASVVSIEAIDGATRLGGWKKGTAEVELLPGLYEFEFSVDWSLSPFHSTSDDDLELLRRTRLLLQPALAYHVGYDLAGGYYFVFVAPIETDEDVVFPPSRSRERCRLALTPGDRERCEPRLKP